MTVIAYIPARGGSKGVSKKNIRHLGEYPLIAYTIEQALSANIFDHVVISTDSNKPLFNRALQGTYPPGSTFKLLNSLISLQENIIKKSTIHATMMLPLMLMFIGLVIYSILIFLMKYKSEVIKIKKEGLDRI